MSYTKVKSMSIKKNGTITAALVSSNVSPQRYETVELFVGYSSKPLSDKLRMIFEDLLGREMQFNESSTSKVYYAYLKAIQHFHSKYDFRINDLWDYKYSESPKLNGRESKRIQVELLRVFKVHLMDNVKLSTREYGVLLSDGHWLYSSSKYKYRKTVVHRKLFHLNQAICYSEMYDGKIIHVDDIGK